MQTTEITQSEATAIQVIHPTASYGIFCYTPVGDIFLNSDWGVYSYSWRSWGAGTFKDFIASLDADYMVKKFDNNYRDTINRNLPKYIKDALIVLVDEFIKHLKKQR